MTRLRAMAMMLAKVNTFADDQVSAGTIWRQLGPETREHWYGKAGQAEAELERLGFQIAPRE